MIPFARLLPLAFLLLGTVPGPGPPAGSSTPPDRSEELEEVLRERSLDPEQPEALERLSELLGKARDRDGELAYLLYAIDAYDRSEGLVGEERATKLRALERRLERVGTGLGKLRSSRNAYLKDLTWVLRLYANNQKKRRSALEVGSQILAYRPDHPVARRLVEEVMASGDRDLRREGERLLNQKELTRTRTFQTQWARIHKRWSSAGIVNSRRYTVKSNIGYDVASKAAHSLDRIADYYADFYGVDAAAITERTPVFLFRTRDEFIEEVNTPFAARPGLLAFISSVYHEKQGNRPARLNSQIFGYDPRDQGRVLESLWPTLWHEASHQYMSLVTRGQQAPPWINEGMSSYFEGARFNREGQILVGLPARSRLQNLIFLLKKGFHPLEEMLKEETQLSGLHYAVYWGVVYYLKHGRDAEGHLLRPQALPRLLEGLRAGVMDPMELFEQGVLRPSGETLAEFEGAWEAWILNLMDLESDGTERSEHFATLGDQRREAGEAELAKELYREALLRAPRSLPALSGMAKLHLAAWEASRKKDRDLADETLVWGDRWHAAALAAGDEAQRNQAADLCGEVDKAGFKKIKKAEARYRRSIEGLIQRTIESERPRAAVAIAGLFLDDILGGERQAELARELRLAGTLHLERPFEAFDGRSLVGLSCGAQAFQVKRGILRGRANRPRHSMLYIDREISPLFHMTGEVRLQDANTLLGFGYAAEESSGMEGFLIRPGDPGEPVDPDRSYEPFDRLERGRAGTLLEEFDPERLGPVHRLGEMTFPLPPDIQAGKWISFRMSRIRPGELALILDGDVVATKLIDPGGTSANLGLLLWGGELELRKLEVVEIDRL